MPEAPTSQSPKYQASARPVLGRGKHGKRVGPPQVTASILSLVVGFVLGPATHRASIEFQAVFGIAAFFLMLWMGLMVLVSFIAFAVDAEDETLVWLAALGGNLGCILSLVFRLHHPWNFAFTFFLQFVFGAIGGFVRFSV